MLTPGTYGARHAFSKAIRGMMTPARSLAAGICLIAAQAAADEGRVDVLALGDSLTQGYGLFDGEGFVPQMTAWLQDRGHNVRIVNAGVSGDTTAGGLSRVAWSLTPEIDAIIVTLGGNDLLRGLDPSMSRSNLDGILKVAQEADLKVLLVGMEAPGNYGPDYKEAFDGMYAELAEDYGTLFYDSFFAGLTQDGSTPADLAPYMQPDGIHPNVAGVAKIVDAMGPTVEALIVVASKDG